MMAWLSITNWVWCWVVIVIKIISINVINVINVIIIIIIIVMIIEPDHASISNWVWQRRESPPASRAKHSE